MKNNPEDIQNASGEKVALFFEAARQAGLEIPDDREFRAAMGKVFAFSEFVSRHSLRKPQIIQELVASGDLFRPFPSKSGDMPEGPKTIYHARLSDRICSIDEEQPFAEKLHEFRLISMIRIIWRDLTGLSDLFQTMSDLSNLADACIESAFHFLMEQLAEKYGYPFDSNKKQQNIVVLGMGKLGARELNLSSDIDLIFAFPEAGQTDHSERSISNEEFFVQLCRKFLKIFGSQSSDGILFRVDMRLRPFGANGPIVMSFNVMEDYYESQGREWERYAMIKARVVAGDRQAGNRLLEQLKPFIYRRYLDYSTYDSLREMKQKIAAEVTRKKLQDNIKLGPGGIREVEFFAQVFQLIRGGVDSILQERSVLKVLKILVAEGYIPQNVSNELHDAYLFLRNTEHRLQAFSDQQLHTLPKDENARLRLAQAMGFDGWQLFANQLNAHMQRVHVHFSEILAGEQQEQGDTVISQLKRLWAEPVLNDENRNLLQSLGYQENDEIIKLLDQFLNAPETRALSHEGRDRVDKLIPLILKQVGEADDPSVTFRRILDLVKTIERRTCYIALILENSTVLSHLIRLAGASPWIISFLSRHPVLLDELLDSRTLFSPPDKATLVKEIKQRIERIPDDDIEFKIETLCVFKQINTLRVAAADITGQYPLMRVSDHLTDIAETVVGEVLGMAWQHLVEKHGRPHCDLKGDVCEKGFAVIAYGKLGGIELGYGSDLDMVFVHAGTGQPTIGGRIEIDSSQFYVRLGQRVVHLLTSHTRAGRLYEVDMRLRPSGSSGLLVTPIDAYETYQSQDAWTWEHQALVRARVICGDKALVSRFGRIRHMILARKREQVALRKEISRMRERMRREHLTSNMDSFDLKQSPGGIVDIEFLVQYLILLKAFQNQEITQWTDNVRLLESLQTAGILKADEAGILKDAYLKMRAVIHLLNLKDRPGKVSKNEFEEIREHVVTLWNQFIEND